MVAGGQRMQRPVPTDRLIAVQALELAPLETSLHFAEDGVETMEYLRAGVADPSVVRPVLTLLDLNLPRKDARAVLAEMKGDPRCGTYLWSC
jgi:CheY-like chemotaxis protein